MTAAELLLDLAERLTEADRKLRDLARAPENRWSSDGAYYDHKAEGVRLALGYVNELRRMTGEDIS